MELSNVLLKSSATGDVALDFGNRELFHEYVTTILSDIVQSCELIDHQKKKFSKEDGSFKLKDFSGNLFTRKPIRTDLQNHYSESTIIQNHVKWLTAISTPQGYSERPQSIWWEFDGIESTLPLYEFNDSGEHVFSFNVPHSDKPDSFGMYFANLCALLLEVVDLFSENTLFSPLELRYKGQIIPIKYTPLKDNLNLGDRTESTKFFRSQPLHSISGTEPTILAIAWHWSLLKEWISFNSGKLEILSFALNRISDWVVPSACRPSEIYEYLARICNVTCKFCYLYGNPDGIAVARGKKIASQSEIETRLKYFDPDQKFALFHSQWEINEFLLDPNLETVLKKLRSLTEEPFFFVTNGNPLTHKVMDILSQVKPVYLIVSTNTLDAPLRSEVMGEKAVNTRTALSCLEYLKNYEIPFGVSLIAFPDISFDELTRTVKELEKVEPAFIRVNMPGFTSSHPLQFEEDTDKVWTSAVNWVKETRSLVDFPIISIPSSYELNIHNETPNEAVISGVIKNSPAWECGLKAGDIIKSINAVPIDIRSDILTILSFLQDKAEICVEREKQILNFRMQLDFDGGYPYSGSIFGKYMLPYGIVVAPGLTRSSANELDQLIKKHHAKKVWVITSSIMLSAAIDLFEKLIPDQLNNIHFILAQNHFLGGNIRIMDMCTVGDFQHSIDDELQTNTAPDLVIIPGTGFNRFGRDLAGRHWSDLDRYYPFPVEILKLGSQFAF